MNEIDDNYNLKISPTDPRFEMPGNQINSGKRINKKFVVGLAAIFGGFVLLGLIIALQPVKQKQVSAKDEALEKQLEYIKTPEVITNAPDFLKPPPSEIPVLGPALPGDIGAAMVESPREYTQGPVQQIPQGPSKEEIKRKKRKEDAIEGGAFFSGIRAREQSSKILPQTDRKDTTQSEMLDKLSGMLQTPEESTMTDSVAKQNMQGEKREFIDTQESGTNAGYINSRLTWPKSMFEVKAGSIIPISIITGINSDLPGEIIGQVRENVYDTITGNHLLIPQGTRLMATYDSVIAYGQERALLCWSQVRMPNGSSINLECAPGIDLAGYSGLSDEVDNHWGRLILGVGLSTVLSAGISLSQGDVEGYTPSITQGMAANAAEQINDVGKQFTKKNLDIQPTIKIKPGFNGNVLVNKDIILTPYKDM